MNKKTDEEKARVHISIYVPPKLKKWLHMEAVRQNTYIKYVVSEYLLIAMKWKKEAELELKGISKETSEELAEIKGYIKEIQKEKMGNIKKQ